MSAVDDIDDDVMKFDNLFIIRLQFIEGVGPQTEIRTENQLQL